MIKLLSYSFGDCSTRQKARQRKRVQKNGVQLGMVGTSRKVEATPGWVWVCSRVETAVKAAVKGLTQRGLEVISSWVTDTCALDPTGDRQTGRWRDELLKRNVKGQQSKMQCKLMCLISPIYTNKINDDILKQSVAPKQVIHNRYQQRAMIIFRLLSVSEQQRSC